MIHSRESSRVVISPLAEKRINDNQCPVCATPKENWYRRKDWRCCTKGCTEDFYKSMLVATSWNDLRAKVIHRDDYTCKFCGVKKKMDVYGLYGDLIVDHIKPIALGGHQWDERNLQTLCGKCNKFKTKMDMSKIARERRIDIGTSEKRKILVEALEKGDLSV